MNEPHVTMKFDEPKAPQFRVNTLDDLQSALKWLGLSQKVYSGSVKADGTPLSLPKGWSSTRNTTGEFTVTHGLGSNGYTVVAMCSTSDWFNFGAVAILETKDKGSFNLNLFHPSNRTAADSDFEFILSLTT